MNTLFPKELLETHVILSASRMTDMPKYYSLELIREVEKRIANGTNIHTLVLWTKHPKCLLENPLFDYLKWLREQGIQLFLQLTITGLGGISLGNCIGQKPLYIEPNAPRFEESLSLLPRIIDLVGKPERIRLRIDPILRIIDYNCNVLSNLKYFPIIVETASKEGIKTFSFSFLEENVHKKVDKRFNDLGVKILAPDENERTNTASWMHEIELRYNIRIYACCVPGLTSSSCIDGRYLEKIHDRQLSTVNSQPLKRKLCGCTESIDLGGWPPKKCSTGCKYCYANPVSQF